MIDYVNGKNLFDISKVFSSSNVKNNNNGTLSVTPTSTSGGVGSSDPRTLKDFAPDLEVGKTYILSATTTGDAKYIYLSGSNRSWFFGKTITITEEDLSSKVLWYANDTGTTFTAVISNIQIEEGSTVTKYEPYIKTINIYLDEPLRKVGNNYDYIDFENRKIYRNTGSVVYDENTNIKLSTSTYFYEEGITTAFYNSIPGNALPDKLGMDCISNLFECKKADAIIKSEPYISGNIGSVIFAVKNETATTIEELQVFLKDNNMEIIYPLNEQAEEMIDIPYLVQINPDLKLTVETKINPEIVVE